MDIFGDNANNTLVGMELPDRIFGRGGNDRLFGDLGNDLLLGEAGQDEIHGDRGDDKLDGGNGNDRLDGGDGWDELRGGVGDDRLYGGGGRDLLYAGSGADTVISSYFRFNGDDPQSDKDFIDLGADTKADRLYLIHDIDTAPSGDSSFIGNDTVAHFDRTRDFLYIRQFEERDESGSEVVNVNARAFLDSNHDKLINAADENVLNIADNLVLLLPLEGSVTLRGLGDEGIAANRIIPVLTDDFPIGAVDQIL